MRYPITIEPGTDTSAWDLAWRCPACSMALRVEAWMGVKRGGDARIWLAEQSAYDVWQAQQRFKTAPMHLRPAPMAA